MIYKKFLILGHPRCGTGYISKLFQLYNIDIGHELMGGDGISCWFYAVTDSIPDFAKTELFSKVRDDFKFEHIICITRDPFFAIPSIYYTETPNEHNKEFWAYKFIEESHNFRRLKTNINDNNIYNLVSLSYLEWYKLIEKNGYDFKIRIEYNETLIKKLIELGYNKIFDTTVDVLYNSRKDEKNIHYGSEFKWNNIDNDIIHKLDDFCCNNGYVKLSERI